LKHHLKTLAKTLDYIARRSPGEYGLFWDPDGTMPWKEFYWALQEDPSLRFVRESTIREIGLLGIPLSFALDGSRLRLVSEVDRPGYPAASEVSGRLYFGLRPRNMVYAPDNGLKAASRPFIALCTDREFALRIAKRREQEPVLIEILAREVSGKGISFLVAGPQLYLVESIPAEFILFPKVRHDLAERVGEHVRRPRAKPAPAVSPGSFTVQQHHIQTYGPPGEFAPKREQKDKRGEWKKQSRKERHKRDM
jgi:putative RNA 2'-phosphotransferase